MDENRETSALKFEIYSFGYHKSCLENVSISLHDDWRPKRIGKIDEKPNTTVDLLNQVNHGKNVESGRPVCLDIGWGFVVYKNDKSSSPSSYPELDLTVPVNTQSVSSTLDKIHCILDSGQHHQIGLNHEVETVSSTIKWHAVECGENHIILLDVDHRAYLYSPSGPRSLDVRARSVSCGNEHVIVLDDRGRVFTMGSGSRAQLGHGNLEDCPDLKQVAELAGLKCEVVAAGGWHSAVISECGDLFIWGWNQSGQLGIVNNGSDTGTCDSPPAKCRRYNDVSDCRHSDTCDDLNDCRHSDTCDDLNDCRHSYTCDDLNDCRHSDTCDDLNDCRHSDTCDGLQSEESCSTSASRTDDDIKIKLKKDVDPVTMLVEPTLVEIDGGKPLMDVACGSRHTAAVTVEHQLYVWGWNKYGQLGVKPDDTRTDSETRRDCVWTPTLNSFFSDEQLAVKRVHAAYWTTVVETECKIPS